MVYGGKLPVLCGVVAEEVSPGEPGFKMYTLDCGHVMRRKAKAGRGKVKCTVCTRNAPDFKQVQIVRISLGADERDYLPLGFVKDEANG